MKIAVITRFLRSPLEGVGQHSYAILNCLINYHPDIEWHLINDGQTGQLLWDDQNVIHHSLTPTTRHPILWHIWYEWRLPQLLKKINPHTVWYPDGFMSLRSKKKSILTIHDLAYLKYPEGSIRSHRKYLEKKMPSQIAKADKIACVSNSIQQEIIETFNINSSKFIVTPNAPHSNFKPLTSDEIEVFRTEHTRSLPYFLYLGSIHPRKNIGNLIKAFEVFKRDNDKPQLLVLAGRWAWKSQQIRRQLEQSTVRDHIILINQFDEIRYQLVGAATTMIYVSHYEGFGMPVIESMACGIPVITTQDSAMQEVAGECGIYVRPHDATHISYAMSESLQFKNQRSLIEKAETFSWKASADGIGQVLFL